MHHVSVTKRESENYTVLEDNVCVCSTDNNLVGTPLCDMCKLRSYLQKGYWIGCDVTHGIVKGFCQPGYCNSDYKSIINNQTVSTDLTSTSVCVEHRTGQLCGQCVAGYSVYYQMWKMFIWIHWGADLLSSRANSCHNSVCNYHANESETDIRNDTECHFLCTDNYSYKQCILSWHNKLYSHSNSLFPCWLIQPGFLLFASAIILSMEWSNSIRQLGYILTM